MAAIRVKKVGGRVIHWSGTPEGVCIRRDNNSDSETEGQTTRTARADYIGNVTCRTCLKAFKERQRKNDF